MTWLRYIPRRATRRTRQRAITDRCPCGKNNFRRYQTAAKVLRHLDGEGDGGVYFCPRGGGYHIATNDRRGNDRRRAAFLRREQP